MGWLEGENLFRGEECHDTHLMGLLQVIPYKGLSLRAMILRSYDDPGFEPMGDGRLEGS